MSTKRKVAACAIGISLLLSNFAQAANFSFSWVSDSSYNLNTWWKDDGPLTVTGLFSGNANDNLITNLTDISVYIDGVGLKGNGNLYTSSIHPSQLGGYEWHSGGAVVSFDGSKNNFMFSDVNFPINNIYTNYFGSIFDGTNQQGYNANTNQEAHGFSSLTIANWKVTQLTASVPEPETYAMLLAGLGLMGAVTRRKQK